MAMRLICYPLLSTRSKWALERARKQDGSPYYYVPRRKLVYRLALELNKTPVEVENQLMAERRYLLKKKATSAKG